MQGASTIASVTEGLRGLFAAELGGAVEVTTLAPARAHAPSAADGAARVNLALVRIAEAPHLRNRPDDALRAGAARSVAAGLDELELVFLVSAQGAAGPGSDPAGWSLLEAALRAVRARPVLELAAGAARASLTPIGASLEDATRLWRALGVELRPALLLAVRPA